MNKEKFLECERNRLLKLQNFRLPYYFKTIGFVLTAVSVLLLFAHGLFPDNKELVKTIAKKGMLVGMLLITISKDKFEDELTLTLRAQSFMLAFILGVIYALVMPYVDYGISNLVKPDSEVLKDLGDFQVLNFMLLIQILFYHMLKRMR